MRTYIPAAGLALLLAAFAPPIAAQAPGAISWTIGKDGARTDGQIQFEISHRTSNSRSTHSRTIALGELRGFSPTALASPSGEPVRFRLARDAGSFDCEGVVRRSRGTGDCAFRADPRFSEGLRRYGIGIATPPQLFSLALAGIGLDYVAELRKQGYAGVTPADLVLAGDHGAGLDYLRAMGALGARPRSLAELVRMRDHGVTPDYVSRLVAEGVTDLPPATLIELRDHGVTPDFIAAFRRLGYGRIPVRSLIDLRDHGVTPDYARALAANGVPRLSPEALIRLRDHGVSADYVAELRRLGYGGLPPEDMIRLRDHGVSAESIRRANAGGGHRPIDELIDLRDRGRI